MKKMILLFAFIGLISSCSNDDDNTNKDTLNGTWNLIDVTCECKPVDFQKGEHVWNFDLSNNKINVVNNPDENLQILDTGSYVFSLKEGKITILSVEYDYYFKNGKLFLSDHPEVDGPLMEFIRN
ncbi:hypothetical protein [Flavivirga rizhaonensis]|uniref:Lipocalin-like domain-containing protein n=1 Tax=Flavivirga rizhaonensis TaxID=2559571 RepID=A0A4V3P570_9FLAO|nr:hypothetical protein [Flavivirga rizhaonensis]TGV04144.1 hypothetical protein EM932_03120 [Flavivirga rizhaonensis]